MKKLVFILFLFSTLASNAIQPKVTKRYFEPEFNYKYAFLLPHARAVKALMGGMFPIYELGVRMPHWGTNDFHARFPHHSFGMVINWSPLSSPEYLGYSVALMPYIDINLKKGKKSWVQFRLGTGLAYIEKPFDRITNNKNLVIGSHLNNITDFVFKYRYNVTQNIEARLGLGIQHFSNGAYTRPNYGANLVNTNIGVKYTIHEYTNTSAKMEADSSRFYFQAGWGSKKIDYVTDKAYSIVSFNAGYSFSFKKSRYLNLQADFIFDESIPHLKEYDYKLKQIDKWIFGLFAFYEKKFGNVSLLFGSGYYLHSPYPSFDQDWSFKNKGGRFYNRAGFKVYIIDGLFAAVNIKTHAGEADNIEFGIGYKLK